VVKEPDRQQETAQWFGDVHRRPQIPMEQDEAWDMPQQMAGKGDWRLRVSGDAEEDHQQGEAPSGACGTQCAEGRGDKSGLGSAAAKLADMINQILVAATSHPTDATSLRSGKGVEAHDGLGGIM
jgi:hypothetical protein